MLKENSLAILRGDVRPTAAADPDGGYPWVIANRFTEVLAAQRYVLELFDTVLVERLGFDLLRDVQLLTPTKKGPLGTDELNVLLQRLVHRKLGGIDVPPQRPNRRPDLLLHDRVIQTRNNYDLGVMNGAVGFVTDVRDKGAGQLTVRFDDQEVEYAAESSRELSLAYALTVHKCVHPDTLVETPQGLLPIRSIRRDHGLIATPDGPRTYDTFIENPDGELLEIVTVDGYRLTVTPEHGIDVWTDDGFARVEARQIVRGAVLRLKLGVTCDPVEVPVLSEPPTVGVNGRNYRYPHAVTPELAEFLGLMVANGTVYNGGFRFTSRHEDVRDRVAELSVSLLGASPRQFMLGNTYAMEVNARQIAGWLRQLGGLKPNDKMVPSCILRSPISLHIAFLRGLFENGSVLMQRDVVRCVEWCSEHVSLRHTVRTMLLRLGIVATGTVGKPNVLRLHGQSARKFGNEVGFVARAKQARALCKTGNETHRHILLTEPEVQKLHIVLTAIKAAVEFGMRSIRGRGYIHRYTAEAVLVRLGEGRQVCGSLDREVAALLRDRLGFHYSAVREVRRVAGPSMCIRVPDDHRFLQNGFCGWNSQGSQTPCVVAVIQKAHTFQHDRNLFYTAVTRAQRAVIVVGDRWGIQACAKKEQVERRKTFLSVLDLPRRGRPRSEHER